MTTSDDSSNSNAPDVSLMNESLKSEKLNQEKKIFLIYTMAKVATTTVFESLKLQYPDIPIHRAHFLSDYWVKEILPASNSEFHVDIKIAEDIYSALKEKSAHRLKIITMVRDPLMRDISDIFESWKGLLKSWKRLPEKLEGLKNINSINDLEIGVLRKYLDTRDHSFPLTWFGTEFKSYLGFDIYSVPFNKERGYSIYKIDRADILCIKLESLNACLKEAIKEFSGIDIELTESLNISAKKDGKEMYRELVENYTAPKQKLELIYNSKLVRHFYSEEEINKFVKKWSRGEYDFTNIRKD